MKLHHNIAANYVGQAWAALMSLAFVPVYIAKLGIESYALISIYSMLQAWLALLDLGMSPTLGREMARFNAGVTSPQLVRDQLRSIEVICGGVALLAATAIASGAGFVATYWLHTDLPHSEVRDALAIIGVVVAIRFCESIYRSALYGLERQAWYNAVNVGLATARFAGGALILIFVESSLWAFFVWQLVISFVALFVLSRKLYGLLPAGERPGRPTAEAMRGIRGFALGMMGINLLSLLLSQADKLVLSKLLPLEQFGYYALAATICSILVAISAPVSQALFPQLTRYASTGDNDRFVSSYHFGAQFIAATSVTFGACLAFFPMQILLTWSGNPQLAAATAPLLRLLAIGTALNVLMQIPYFGLLATGRTRFPFWVNVIALCFFVPALWLGVPAYGAMGSAVAWVALNLGYVLIGVPLLHRGFLPREMLSWYLRDTLPPIVAVSAIGVLALAIAPASGAGRLYWLLYLGAYGFATLVAAIATVQLLRTPLIALFRHVRRAQKI